MSGVDDPFSVAKRRSNCVIEGPGRPRQDIRLVWGCYPLDPIVDRNVQLKGQIIRRVSLGAWVYSPKVRHPSCDRGDLDDARCHETDLPR